MFFQRSKIYLLTLVVIIGVSAFFFFQKNAANGNENTVQEADSTHENSEENDDQSKKSKGNPNPSDIITGNFEKIKIDEALLSKNFSNSLLEAGRCLNLSAISAHEFLEANSENLANILKPDMGEVVMKNEEKVESYFQTAGGEKRKLRLEMDYTGEATVVRRLTYSTQSENSNWIEQELTPEQSEDPSESFISSLMNEGDLYYEEKLAKLYFQNGEDISYFSSDGRILSYEFYHESKKFTCKQLQSDSPKCVCL